MKPAAAVEPEASTLDTIAALLPPELQARFYKRMAHMRKLPADDELLQIAEAMGFLALIMQQAPGAVARERAQLAEVLASALTHLKASEQAAAAYYRTLDQRLTQLPPAIAQSLKAEAIAARITEELRQRFAQTGMPETAQVLNIISARAQQSATELSRSMDAFTHPKTGAMPRLDQALGQMYTSVHQAAEHAKQVSESLHTQVQRSVFTLTGGALAIGFVLGMLFFKWMAR